ncbi:MAG TPA: PD-(D/E)XK nuclease family protein [Blastocatellia bacterium]|nr:PD-(D/E)XK nuclease family protein [Blastocatellia bacterium]
MTELKNEFSWSVSRHRAFETCRRLYFLHHYAHWGGWEYGADEQAKKCYLFTKMHTLDSWAGDIIHRTIAAALKRLWQGQSPNLDAMKQQAIKHLRDGWTQSKERLWEQNPKKFVNLFEHYYRIEISPERTAELKARVLACLENFWNSPVLRFIRSVDRSGWKAIEQLTRFRLGEIPIWIKIDFALLDQGHLFIYDWKSGREDEEDRKQLVCYALYAVDQWGIPPDRITIVPFYLRENAVREYTLTAEEIINTKEEIFQSAAEMLALLDDPRENRGRIENFPMTTDRRKCERCFFQEICYGGRFQLGRM